jgi:SAM-dependent methyltransferase
MTEAFDWRGRVGEVWAEEWRRTDRALAPLNHALLEAAAMGLPPGPKILDLGCGAGTTSFAFADAFPRAAITGVDLSDALIAVARARAANRTGLAFEVGDASRWTPADGGAFDAIVSRHGVMFFDDPVAAFAHLRSIAAPNARLIFSCFRARAENQWAEALRPIVEAYAPQMLAGPSPATGPFAFADPARITRILTAAGFAAPRIAPFDFDYVAGEGGEDPVAEAVALFGRIGPFAAMLREVDPASAAAARDQLAEIAAAHLAGGRISFRAAAWIVSTEPDPERPS